MVLERPKSSKNILTLFALQLVAKLFKDSSETHSPLSELIVEDIPELPSTDTGIVTTGEVDTAADTGAELAVVGTG